ESALKHRTQKWTCTFGINPMLLPLTRASFKADPKRRASENRIHFSARCSRTSDGKLAGRRLSCRDGRDRPAMTEGAPRSSHDDFTALFLVITGLVRVIPI